MPEVITAMGAALRQGSFLQYSGMGALLWGNTKSALTEIIHKRSGCVLRFRNLEAAERRREQCSEYHVSSSAINRGHCPFGAILEGPVLIAKESRETDLHRGHPQCPPKP
jgi:hypothetical protein